MKKPKPKQIADVPPELWIRLRRQAKKEGRLFSAFMVELLSEAISERERKNITDGLKAGLKLRRENVK
ncbi:MAG: hypothetical protein JRI72_16350 [Deltaproteobacteria bacterium]|nr:hypothetical protein [Deltaproteobacteria bacterium]